MEDKKRFVLENCICEKRQDCSKEGGERGKGFCFPMIGKKQLHNRGKRMHLRRLPSIRENELKEPITIALGVRRRSNKKVRRRLAIVNPSARSTTGKYLLPSIFLFIAALNLLFFKYFSSN